MISVHSNGYSSSRIEVHVDTHSERSVVTNSDHIYDTKVIFINYEAVLQLDGSIFCEGEFSFSYLSF